MSESALKAADKAGVAAVKFVERKVIRRALRVVEKGALDATLINDNGLDDQGSEVILTERAKRVAMDMRKSKRHAPVYIEVLLRRIEGAEKADALRDQGPRPPLNVGVFVQVQAPEYPTLALDPRRDT